MLQNQESRLERILGSRSTHATLSLEAEENFITPISAEKTSEEEQSGKVSSDVRTDHLDNELPSNVQTAQTGSSKGLHESSKIVTDTRKEEMNIPESEVDHLLEDTSTNLPQSTKLLTSLNENQSLDKGYPIEKRKLVRVVFNVTLAFLLVAKWTYVNFDVLHSKSDGNSYVSSQMLSFHSESLMWPFLALQLILAFVTRLQKTSQSAFISMLTVALQLCGISIQFTHKINFVLTALLAALKDFVVFLFSVVVFHHIVDCFVKNGLLKQGSV